jgi:hypothetical protein
MLYKAIKTINAPLNTFYGIIFQKNIYSENLEKNISEFKPNVKLIDGLTEGPACTVHEYLRDFVYDDDTGINQVILMVLC